MGVCVWVGGVCVEEGGEGGEEGGRRRDGVVVVSDVMLERCLFVSLHSRTQLWEPRPCGHNPPVPLPLHRAPKTLTPHL